MVVAYGVLWARNGHAATAEELKANVVTAAASNAGMRRFATLKWAVFMSEMVRLARIAVKIHHPEHLRVSTPKWLCKSRTQHPHR
jgi:hypothetical protein